MISPMKTESTPVAKAMPRNPCERPVFIVGPGRSGTTLLRSLLSAHPHLTVTPETHFMAWAQPWGLEQGAPEDFFAFWSHYTESNWFKDLGIDAEECLRRIEAVEDRSFAGVFGTILSLFAEKRNKPRVGEKTPGHSQFLGYILQWFPKAQVLVTQRDPRAVIASQLKTPYIGKRIGPPSLRRGLATNSRLEQVLWHMEDWRELYESRLSPYETDSRFHRVVYEDLVDSPETAIRGIFAFLEEPFDPDVLSGRNDASVSPPTAKWENEEMNRWRREHHRRSLGAIVATSLDKWRRSLSRMEVAMIEGRCGALMNRMGYPLVASRRERFFGRLFAAVFSRIVALEKASRSAARKIPFDTPGAKTALQDISFRLSGAVRRSGNSLRRRLEGHPKEETFPRYFERAGGKSGAGYMVVHPGAVADNPLPVNVPSRLQLPSDAGWWGFSFRQVPSRRSGETIVATIPCCRLLFFRDKRDDFHPAILTDESHSLDMREIHFRSGHAGALRRGGTPVRLERATWIVERVYHNHSHWFTAHLPKLLLLKKTGRIADVLLPSERTSVMDESMRMVGIDPSAFRTFETNQVLDVDELSVVSTDRFRPELLQMVPEAFGINGATRPQRRIYISRERAARRKLVNETEVWSVLRSFGFEKVVMEDLSFDRQVDLMKQTEILVSPHGAGLTNMMFCPRGAIVVEIADLGFPNPNFYALASALGHRYCIVRATPLGMAHQLERDMTVDPQAVASTLKYAELRGGVSEIGRRAG